ncbi:hypothetical protein ACFU6I_48020 [Streptomyces sp. NPDC057486]|uniref:hypothetical protein n=1 Tax=Streptomyces sp. NPDC057486 TaxID=3346145 RepID=UPI0036B97E3B
MVADDANDGLPDFPLTDPVLGGCRVGFIGHAEVGAQDVDAHLALFCPVVGEADECVDAREADGGLVVAELFGGGGVPLGELACVRAVCVALGEELFAVGVETGEDSADQGQCCHGRLEDVIDVDRLGRLLVGGRLREVVVGVVVDDPTEGTGRYQRHGCHDPDGPEVRCVPALGGLALASE